MQTDADTNQSTFLSNGPTGNYNANIWMNTSWSNASLEILLCSKQDQNMLEQDKNRVIGQETPTENNRTENKSTIIVQVKSDFIH